jgi:hypothetical protein
MEPGATPKPWSAVSRTELAFCGMGERYHVLHFHQMLYQQCMVCGHSLQLKEPAQLLQLHNYFGNFMNAIPKRLMAWTKLQMQLTIQ